MNDRWRYYVSLLRRKAVIGLIIAGVLLGWLLIGTVRFVATPSAEVHYHADFAVFANGRRATFTGPQYYQEVSSCDEGSSPLGRVHLHDEDSHLIHVHAGTVTWGDLFINLGWSLNNSMLYDGTNAYIDGQGGSLHFILNGQPTRSIANEVIHDRDRLLVSFGNDDAAALNRQFSQVETDAAKADITPDPSTCQGPEPQSPGTRLRQAFWF